MIIKARCSVVMLGQVWRGKVRRVFPDLYKKQDRIIRLFHWTHIPESGGSNPSPAINK